MIRSRGDNRLVRVKRLHIANAKRADGGCRRKTSVKRDGLLYDDQVRKLRPQADDFNGDMKWCVAFRACRWRGSILTLPEFPRLPPGWSRMAGPLPRAATTLSGDGWVGFDYSKAFGQPVRCITRRGDASAGQLHEGRLLFPGFGTSAGATVIVDDIVVPIEVGLIKLLA